MVRYRQMGAAGLFPKVIWECRLSAIIGAAAPHDDESLTMLVQSLGVAARTACDGPAALAAVSEFKLEKVIMDLGLPGMDGYELAREIRKLPNGHNLILIALSGWGQEEVRQRALKGGFARFFVKPLDIEALKNVLRSSGAAALS